MKKVNIKRINNGLLIISEDGIVFAKDHEEVCSWFNSALADGVFSIVSKMKSGEEWTVEFSTPIPIA